MTPDELSARHGAAEQDAREAGRLALGYLAAERPLEFALKGPQDLVTVADLAVERRIVARLRSQFPEDAFIGEEGGGVSS